MTRTARGGAVKGGVHERPFAGHTALVTGGAVRLGNVLCRRLAAVGADVVVHANGSATLAERLAATLEATGVRAAAVQLDLSDAASAEALVPAAQAAIGRAPTMLVNSASVYGAATLETLTRGTLEASVAVDAWAPLAATRALAGLPPLGDGAPRAVVNLLDTRLTDADWGHMGYHLAKGVLAELTRLTAVHYAPKLRVNGVAPGAVLPSSGLGEAQAKRMMAGAARATLTGRNPTPDDVADAVLYLLGAQSVTGQVLFVDGGRHVMRAAV